MVTRPGRSWARNDSRCSVKRLKFIKRLLGPRFDLSWRSATNCSTYSEMLWTVACLAWSSWVTRARRSTVERRFGGATHAQRGTGAEPNVTRPGRFRSSVLRQGK